MGHGLIRNALMKRGGTSIEKADPTAFSCELRLPFGNGKMKGEDTL